MLLISLFMMVGIFIFALADIFTNNSPKRAIISNIIGVIFAFVIILGLNYFLLPTQRFSTFLLGNIIYTALYIAIRSFWGITKIPDFIVIGLETISVILFCIIGISSAFSVKRTANSIHSEKIASSQAPTFKRGETPVGIAPDAVFHEVSGAMSNVPNSNLYSPSGSISAQYYHGKPTYVVPLTFKSFFQAQHAKTIPGYFRISATDPNANPHFVKKTIHYSSDMYLGHNMVRRMYASHHDYVPLSNKPQLEISENGTPYEVEDAFKPTIMNNRPRFNNLKIIVGNATNGKIKIYNHAKDTPKFLNENLTSNVADKIDQYYGWYPKGHGWWNARSIIGHQTDIKVPTDGPEDGVTTVFNANHTISYFTDFTSNSSNTHSALGFSMVNARSGKLKFYHANMLDSDMAKDIAENSGNFRTNKYSAEIPVPYKIKGHQTWVMSILDNSNNQRGFFFLDGNDSGRIKAYSESSLTDCLDNYQQSLINNVGSISNSGSSKKEHISGKVDRISLSTNGKAVFNLQGSHKIYVVDDSEYPSAQLIKSGDNVKFVTGSNGTENTVTNFKDNTFLE